MLFASSRCWTAAMPASNACSWLNVILKCRFRFACRFPRFISLDAYFNPHACYLTPVLFFFHALASFSALLHRFPRLCIVFRTLASFPAPLHRFPCLCLVFRAFALFPTSLHRFPCLCIIFHAFASISASLHRFPCLCLVTRAFASISVLLHHFPCLHRFPHSHCFLCPLWFIPRMSLALPGFPRSFVLSPAFALGL